MDGYSSTCTPWVTHRSQGGHLSRDGIWHYPSSSRRIFYALSHHLPAWPLRFCDATQVTFRLFDLNYLELLNATVVSLTIKFCLLPLMCLRDMMVSVNHHYNHHTMDHFPSSAEQLLSLSMVTMILSLLIASSRRFTTIPTLLNHNLIIHPLILHHPHSQHSLWTSWSFPCICIS